MSPGIFTMHRYFIRANRMGDDGIPHRLAKMAPVLCRRSRAPQGALALVLGGANIGAAMKTKRLPLHLRWRPFVRLRRWGWRGVAGRSTPPFTRPVCRAASAGVKSPAALEAAHRP